MNDQPRIAFALLTLRLGVFVVMLVWTLDKFVNPEHAARVYENFYLIGGLGRPVFLLIGAVELVVLAGFLLGYQKRVTYGLVLVLHGVSTLSAYHQ